MAQGAAREIAIVGASGVVGRAAVEYFCAKGWSVIALSRRRPDDIAGSFRHFSVDLQNPKACQALAGSLRSVTHVVFAALHEKSDLIAGWRDQDQMQTNLAMLRNLFEVLIPNARHLRHVSMLQGTKAYGAHIHRIAIPAREDSPRDNHENFYWLQEDYIKARAAEHGFGVTIWRPQIVLGDAIGVALNLMPVIGAFGALCRATGRGFGFPGGPDYVTEAIDARLLAEAFHWATDAPAAANQVFNITNGDVLVWRNVWPAMARALKLPPAPDSRLSLAEFLPAQSAVWDALRKKSGLPELALQTVLGQSHHYADFVFATAAEKTLPPVIVSTVKLRQAGFSSCMDSEASLAHWLKRLTERRILPDLA
jgi:nucleoside-diphosphate-sugar epimerase